MYRAHVVSRVPWHTRTLVSLIVTMLLTAETTDNGQRRVYFTRFNSVITFFTDDGEGGIVPHAHPGEIAYPTPTEHQLAAVRDAMLAETARRLDCPIEEVLRHSLEQVAKVADPILSHHYHWAGRTRAKGRTADKPFPRR